MNQQALSAFIWSVADLLRGDYKPADYGKVILPFTVLRRLAFRSLIAGAPQIKTGFKTGLAPPTVSRAVYAITHEPLKTSIRTIRYRALARNRIDASEAA